MNGSGFNLLKDISKSSDDISVMKDFERNKFQFVVFVL